MWNAGGGAARDNLAGALSSIHSHVSVVAGKTSTQEWSWYEAVTPDKSTSSGIQDYAIAACAASPQERVESASHTSSAATYKAMGAVTHGIIALMFLE